MESLLAKGDKRQTALCRRFAAEDAGDASRTMRTIGISSAKSGGASLRLSNLGSHSNQLLQMTKLLTVFEVSGTEAEAVRGFSK